LDKVPIKEAMGAFSGMLKPVFKDLPPDSAEGASVKSHLVKAAEFKRRRAAQAL
jgi:hypothetical protein